MASGDESDAAPMAGGNRSSVGPGGEGAANHNQPRRTRTKEAHQEVLDELAQETKRVTLLEREEQQLKNRKHVSRVVFVFGINDDRKSQVDVEKEFASFRNRQEDGRELTGVLLFLGQTAVSFLEGPTELLFKAVELFHGLSQDIQPAPVMPLPPADMRANAPAGRQETEPPAQPRAALIGAVRVLYFTELHGVRTSTGWCGVVSTAKPGGGAQMNLEDGAHEAAFMLYRKLLILSLKVRDAAGNDASADALQGHYRRQADFMPLPDEVNLLIGKQGAEYFFTFQEFQKVFMKPFQLVLNSELLWPMSPALSY